MISTRPPSNQGAASTTCALESSVGSSGPWNANSSLYAHLFDVTFGDHSIALVMNDPTWSADWLRPVCSYLGTYSSSSCSFLQIIIP
mmetsp:Transcript_1724/g.3668  ORF Transcript_1724/g.3668 Transcript_1724/m.3668 type:complete len:87 (-) Transcript_1724:95-355(-)